MGINSGFKGLICRLWLKNGQSEGLWHSAALTSWHSSLNALTFSYFAYRDTWQTKNPNIPTCFQVLQQTDVATRMYSQRVSLGVKWGKSETTRCTTWYIYIQPHSKQQTLLSSFFLFRPQFPTTHSHQHASIIYKQNTHIAKWFCTANRLQNYKSLYPY